MIMECSPDAEYRMYEEAERQKKERAKRKCPLNGSPEDYKRYLYGWIDFDDIEIVPTERKQ